MKRPFRSKSNWMILVIVLSFWVSNSYGNLTLPPTNLPNTTLPTTSAVEEIVTPATDLVQEFLRKTVTQKDITLRLGPGSYSLKSYVFSGKICNPACNLTLVASTSGVFFSNMYLQFMDFNRVYLNGIVFNSSMILPNISRFLYFNSNVSYASILYCQFTSKLISSSLSFIRSDALGISIFQTQFNGGNFINSTSIIVEISDSTFFDLFSSPSVSFTGSSTIEIENSIFNRSTNNYQTNSALQISNSNVIFILKSQFVGHSCAINNYGPSFITVDTANFTDNSLTLFTNLTATVTITNSMWKEEGNNFSSAFEFHGNSTLFVLEGCYFSVYSIRITGELYQLQVTESLIQLPFIFPLVKDSILLSNNQIQGASAGFAVNFPWNQRVVIVEHNRFEDEAAVMKPPSLSNSNLQIVSLRGNNFTGNFPKEFFNYPNLKYLDLRENKLDMRDYDYQSVPVQISDCYFQSAFHCDSPFTFPSQDRCNSSCYEFSEDVPETMATTIPPTTTTVTTSPMTTITSSPSSTDFPTSPSSSTDLPTSFPSSTDLPTSEYIITTNPIETIEVSTDFTTLEGFLTTDSPISESTLLPSTLDFETTSHPAEITSTIEPLTNTQSASTSSPSTTSFPPSQEFSSTKIPQFSTLPAIDFESSTFPPTTDYPTILISTSTEAPITSFPSSSSFPTSISFETSTIPPSIDPPSNQESFCQRISQIEATSNEEEAFSLLKNLTEDILTGNLLLRDPLSYCEPLCHTALKVSISKGASAIERLCNSSILNTGQKISEEVAQLILVSFADYSFYLENATQLFTSMDLVAFKVLNSSKNSFIVENPSIDFSAFKLNSSFPSSFSFSFQESASFELPALDYINADYVEFSVLKFSVEMSGNNSTLNPRFVSNLTGLSLFDNEGNKLRVRDTSDNIMIQLKANEILDLETNYSCLYWDEDLLAWKTDGCITEVNYNEGTVNCHCNHLTNFTIGKWKKNDNDTDSAIPPLSQGTVVAVVIIACVVGVVLIIIAVAIVVFIIKRRRKTNKKIMMMEMSLLPTEFIHSEDVEIGEKIGNGAYGIVFRGKYHKTTLVVLKKLQKVEGILSFVKEGNLMKTLHHPHIVQFLGFYQDSDRAMFMVLEYMAIGSLLSLLSSGRQLDVPQLLSMARDIAAGLTYLEENGILHCEIAARNILVRLDDYGFHAKLSDFGMARQPSTKTIVSSDPLATSKIPIRWAAPEILNGGEHSHKSDVWSFAVVMYEMSSRGKIPYPLVNNEEVAEYVKGGGHPEISERWPRDVHQIISRCWNMTPSLRPSFALLYRSIPLLIPVRPLAQVSNGDLEDDRTSYENRYETETNVSSI